MAGALAHEINQPLTALTNTVNAVRRMMANGNAHRIDAYHEIMDEAVELALRTGRIIGHLREFVTRDEAEMRIETLSVLIRDASDFALAGSAARTLRSGSPLIRRPRMCWQTGFRYNNCWSTCCGTPMKR
jgi:C4-dicarboxylate-specific signal transduction histidine kinase